MTTYRITGEEVISRRLSVGYADGNGRTTEAGGGGLSKMSVIRHPIIIDHRIMNVYREPILADYECAAWELYKKARKEFNDAGDYAADFAFAAIKDHLLRADRRVWLHWEPESRLNIPVGALLDEGLKADTNQ